MVEEEARKEACRSARRACKKVFEKREARGRGESGPGRPRGQETRRVLLRTRPCKRRSLSFTPMSSTANYNYSGESTLPALIASAENLCAIIRLCCASKSDR
jgi:hypothetical protein